MIVIDEEPNAASIDLIIIINFLELLLLNKYCHHDGNTHLLQCLWPDPPIMHSLNVATS